MIVAIWVVAWLCHMIWYAQKTQLNFKTIRSQSLKDNFTPINFIGPGNDFAGGIMRLPNKKLAKPEKIDDKITCTSQVRWLYFNSQRGERLRPLDQETATSIPTRGGNRLRVSGWRYTDCTSTSKTNSFVEYSIFGSIQYTYRGISYYLVAGRDIDYGKNRLWSKRVHSLQYINNKTPLWYIYDTAGGVAFVWGRIWSGRPGEVIASALRKQHEELLKKIEKWANINTEVFQQSNGGVTIFWNIAVAWYENLAAVNTKLWLAVLGNIGIGDGYTKRTKRSILWNQSDTSNIYGASNINSSHRFNKAQKNATKLCRWLTPKTGARRWITWESDKVLCVKSTRARPLTIRLTKNNQDEIGASTKVHIDWRTVIVEEWDIAIAWSHGRASEPLEFMIQKGNLYVQWWDVDLININNQWFPATTNPASTQWLYYHANILVHGLILGKSNSSINIPHKLYIHGKFASLNTASTPRAGRCSQLGINCTSGTWSQKIPLESVFTRSCDPLTWKWPDGAGCKDSRDDFALVPLIIIDKSNPWRLLSK